MKKKIYALITILLMTILLPGCGRDLEETNEIITTLEEFTTSESITSTSNIETEDLTTQIIETEIITTEIITTDSEKNTIEKESATKSEEETTTKSEEETTVNKQEETTSALVIPEGTGIRYETDKNAPWIAIDAGHQGKGNKEKEPVGPGATELKTKVASGATGVATGTPEYELTLTVAIMLKDELISRGYNVLMIRETHDVNISNAERALMANEANVDAFIRIHGNSAANKNAKGILTMCQSKNNPYCGEIYKDSRSLSEKVLKELIEQTSAQDRGVVETDTMSGINWCKVPVTIVEMGFMSNEYEDKLMATKEYQMKLVEGMANGLEKYFGKY